MIVFKDYFESNFPGTVDLFIKVQACFTPSKVYSLDGTDTSCIIFSLVAVGANITNPLATFFIVLLATGTITYLKVKYKHQSKIENL